ncbi:hypothetical protein CN931_11055 [Bacillus sp. AFS054943]|nr:hypothetical protein CN931_11055 [Bacillus sp. AFS054943]
MSDKTKISYEYFIKSIIQHPILLKKLFEEIPQSKVSEFSAWEIPILKGIEKSTELKLADKYIIDTITQQLELAQVSVDENELLIQIVRNFMESNAAINMKQEITLFELIVELLSSLKVLSTYNEVTINAPAIIIQNENVIDADENFTELEVVDNHLKLRDYVQLGEEKESWCQQKYIWQVIQVDNERSLLWADTPYSIHCNGKRWSESSTRKILNEHGDIVPFHQSIMRLFSEKEKSLMLPTEIESIVTGDLFEGPLKDYMEQDKENHTILTTDTIFALSLHELKTLVYDQNLLYRKKETFVLRDISEESENESKVSFVDSTIDTATYYLEHTAYPLGYTYPAVYISNIKFPYGTGREDDPYRMEE